MKLKILALLSLLCLLISSCEKDADVVDDTIDDNETEEVATCTVSFEVNGGSYINPIEVVCGYPIDRPIDPTQESCEFEDWYDSSTFSTIWDFATPIVENIILYAKWAEIIDESDDEESDDETIMPDGYTPIYTASDLYNIRYDLSGNYILMKDIDLSGYTNWTPIGTSSTSPFTGVFDGGGYTISNLTINKTSSSYIGLFGYVKGGKISNIILDNPQINGNYYVGAVCGYLWSSSITDCGVEGGLIEGSFSVGGVVGLAFSPVTACYNTGIVLGDLDVGGVVGRAFSSSPVTSCYNMGKVSSNADFSFVGGVVGWAGYSVTSCYNTGEISGITSVGGVVGKADYSITTCYNTGEISGVTSVGGVVGKADDSATILSCCYLTISGMSYTNSHGTASETLVETMVSEAFVDTLNTAAEATYYQHDTEWVNGGYPILNWQ